MSQAQFLASLLGKQVRLVEDEHAWTLAGADLLEHLLDRLAHRGLVVLGR